MLHLTDTVHTYNTCVCACVCMSICCVVLCIYPELFVSTRAVSEGNVLSCTATACCILHRVEACSRTVHGSHS